ncbi:MAG: hypothetical protein R2932_48215 [Caldilineaceae bacterium]
MMATKKRSAPNELVQTLRDLASDPEAQAAHAAILLDARHGAEVIISALQILTRQPHPPARRFGHSTITIVGAVSNAIPQLIRGLRLSGRCAKLSCPRISPELWR